MTLTLYADFTEPLSRIAATRADALIGADVAVDWRAVVAHPSIRVRVQPLSEETRATITAAEATWHEEALPGESVPWRMPDAAPAPGPAVVAYAEAVGAGVGDHVRHLLFTSYWQHHSDIGNPDVLRHLLTLPILHGRSEADVLREYGYAVSVGGGPITTDAWRLRARWREGYDTLDRPELPVLIEAEQQHTGWAAVRRLGELVTESGAIFTRGNPYPLPPLPLAAQRRDLPRPGLRPIWRDAYLLRAGSPAPH